LDVLIKSMALSGERQKEVITVKIKDICEQEIRGNWSKFLLSDKRKVRLDEERSDELITPSLVTNIARALTSVQDTRPP